MQTSHVNSRSNMAGYVLAVIVLSITGCGEPDVAKPAASREEMVEVRIDDATIAQSDPMAVIDPLWWTVNIYDGPAEYEKSLLPFSRAQRQVLGMLWYEAEVNNGGHDQFYSNSTGIVWRDALEGFEAVGLPEVAVILRESARRLGGSPSLYRAKRNEQLEKVSPNFQDLDDQYYELERKISVDDKIMSFIRCRPNDFYFLGVVRKPVSAKPNRD